MLSISERKVDGSLLWGQQKERKAVSFSRVSLKDSSNIIWPMENPLGTKFRSKFTLEIRVIECWDGGPSRQTLTGSGKVEGSKDHWIKINGSTRKEDHCYLVNCLDCRRWRSNRWPWTLDNKKKFDLKVHSFNNNQSHPR